MVFEDVSLRSVSIEKSTAAARLPRVGEKENKTREKGLNVCKHPDCGNSKTIYARRADLRRHQARHSSDNFLCGCCKYGRGIIFKPQSHRKDHLRQHMINKHNSNDFHFCEVENCCGGATLAFSTKQCLSQHLYREHNKAPVGAVEYQKPVNDLNTGITDGESSN